MQDPQPAQLPGAPRHNSNGGTPQRTWSQERGSGSILPAGIGQPETGANKGIREVLEPTVEAKGR